MNEVISKAIFDAQAVHLANPRLLELRGWIVNSLDYPTVDITFTAPARRPFRVRMIAKDWDTSPPAIELLSASGEYLTTITTPKGSGVINAGLHHNTQRPFICTPGSLEYHTHQNHVGDKWENYQRKSAFDLGGILTQIYSAWRTTIDG